jgi:hypothetical protein
MATAAEAGGTCDSIIINNNNNNNNKKPVSYAFKYLNSLCKAAVVNFKLLLLFYLMGLRVLSSNLLFYDFYLYALLAFSLNQRIRCMHDTVKFC